MGCLWPKERPEQQQSRVVRPMQDSLNQINKQKDKYKIQCEKQFQKSFNQNEKLNEQQKDTMERLTKQLQKYKHNEDSFDEIKRLIAILLEYKDKQIKNKYIFIQQKDKQIQDLNNRFNQCQQIYENNEETFKNQIKKLKQLLEDKDKQIKNLSNQLNKLRQLHKNPINPSIERFFAKNILQPQDKYYIVEQIQRVVQKKITKTNLIYQYDPYHQVNFHLQIDNKDNLLLIIKTDQQYILGAWYEGAIYPSMNQSKNSFIFTLTHKKCYPLKKQKKAVIYDAQHIIFGMSEIRLKSGDNQLFSNFGVVENGCYNNPNKQGRNILTGSKNPQVSIKFYEFFQLIYDQ